MEPVTAAGSIRKLANAALVASSTAVIDGRSAKMSAAAEVDSRAAILAQQVDTIKRAFLKAVDQAYESTPNGVRLGHYEDGRLRFPIPWSVRSYRTYSLGYTTSALLRLLLINWPNGFWQLTGSLPVPPLVFLTDGRAWFLNTKAYPTRASVVAATTPWPTLDYVAHLEKELSVTASKTRAKYRRGKGKGKNARR